MRGRIRKLSIWLQNTLHIGMRAKLILVFLVVKVIPLILLTAIAWRQMVILGNELRDIAINDSSAALSALATENIERLTTDTAGQVADFLYDRDSDILHLAGLAPTEDNYRLFAEGRQGRVMLSGEWSLTGDGQSWERADDSPSDGAGGAGGVSTNMENNDMDGFHYREPDTYLYKTIPLYDEITFIDLDGNEVVKVVADSSKINYPLDSRKKNVSVRENTFIKAETYFEQLSSLAPGEIYVSDVIGAYVGTNYIGMYTPDHVAKAAEERGYDIPYAPQAQAYAGEENPNGERFEGIIRWATPVTDDAGEVIGYVTLALNHDHIMEFVDHITPMNERYTELPNAYEGNYAFIWDYQCRSICHPRHHSIAGFNPETGEPEIPWLESSIYDAWQASGVERWTEFVQGIQAFDLQSRSKKPAPALTKAGLVGLDGRYLNNAPQCTGWMDLTADGGSGSFYILWSGLYKLTTAAAIPYYTGHYAPSEDNGYSMRGFGFVAIGAGLDDFAEPVRETEEKLGTAIEANLSNTSMQLIVTSTIIIIFVVSIAIWMASTITGNITRLIQGISRFRSGERQFRFHSPVKDEFGTLADSFDDMADSIVDSAKNPLAITDMGERVIYMNQAGLSLCGMKLEEIVGTQYGDKSVYPGNSIYCPIKALKLGREPEIYAVPNKNRYIKGTANYLYSSEGRRIGYIVETVDITEMVLERNKIEEQRTLLDRIFSASPDLIWYQNVEGVYLAVNPRFAAIAGKPVGAFLGNTAEAILPAEIARSFAANDRAATEAKLPCYSEEKIAFVDGHEETLDAVRTPVFDINGALVGLLGFARDVTARVTIESELRKTQLDLEQAVNDANSANEHKGEFLARMSHEIRTPMNAIIGLANIVERELGLLSEENEGIAGARAHVKQIEASSQHLLGLLNDILDISKIEAGKIELTDETMELSKLADTVAGIIRPRCDEKKIEFVTRFDKFPTGCFRGDSLRLRQVLINLLGNAVKFTPDQGRITFGIEQTDSRKGEVLVRFSVRDTGIGISPEMIATIFQPFEQGGKTITRQYGGTGLGLAISRRIVQLFGGDIKLESAMGKGSEFSFSLWLPEAEAEPTADVATTDVTGMFKNKRALLVDDVDINRMIVMHLLEITGMAIDEADDGLVAVQTFSASPVNTYDIIFMDVQMPNMDGYEATDAIRALSRPDAGQVPIVALTANAFADDIDKALSHGMNAHITKPVDMDKLVNILLRYFGKK